MIKEQIFSDQEIADIRDLTPGVQHVIHFNNAGAALMNNKVANTIQEYQEHELLYGGYETAVKYHPEIEQAYSNIAEYLQCQAAEIALMENATVAWQQAFLSLPLQQGDIILTSMAEYASNYIAFLQLQKRLGIEVQAIPNNEYGEVDIQALQQMITPRVKLIAITHVPTNGGLVNPAEEIGEIARKHQTWYLLDACQSVGQMPLNVQEIGCDFLSATSRKFLRGPRGIGFLYVNKSRLESLEPPLLDLHGATWSTPQSYQVRADARRFENWEFNLASVVGLSAAVRYALDLGIDRIWQRIQYLAHQLRGKLEDIPGVMTHDLGRTKSGIISFNGPFDAEELKTQLLQAGFNTSLIVPEGTLLDMNERGLGTMIRASVHYYNTEKEVQQFVDFIREQIK